MSFRIVSSLLFVAVFSLSGQALAAGEPFVIPPALLRDVRDAPIPVRVCPSDRGAQCAREFYKLADEQLNVVYMATRKRLQSAGQVREEENLVRAQRAWVKFRDAHCTYAGGFMSAETGLNSFYGIACMEVETIRRTYYLQPYSQ